MTSNLTYPREWVVAMPIHMSVYMTTEQRKLTLFGIKFTQQLLRGLKAFGDHGEHLGPCSLSIINKSLPNKMSNFTMVPLHPMKIHLIPHNPYVPEGKRVECRRTARLLNWMVSPNTAWRHCTSSRLLVKSPKMSLVNCHMRRAWGQDQNLWMTNSATPEAHVGQAWGMVGDISPRHSLTTTALWAIFQISSDAFRDCSVSQISNHGKSKSSGRTAGHSKNANWGGAQYELGAISSLWPWCSQESQNDKAKKDEPGPRWALRSNHRRRALWSSFVLGWWGLF